MDVYLKTDPATPSSLSITPTYTVQNPADGETLHLGDADMFREISLKLTGNGDMVIRGLAVEYDERR